MSEDIKTEKIEASKEMPNEYETLEKVADEMLATLKTVTQNLQQQQANNSMLIAQLMNYINKIETEKKKSD